MLSWCSVSRYSATAQAALRSGESWRPTAKVLSLSPRSLYHRAAMAATRLESSPPERKTPTGTSPIIWPSTVAMSFSRTSRRISAGGSDPGGDPARGAREAHSNGRRPDDGRRAGRRLSLRWARLEPRRRHRRPLVQRARREAQNLRGGPPRLPRPQGRPGRGRVPRNGAPRERLYGRGRPGGLARGGPLHREL